MQPNALDRFSDRFLAPELRGDTCRESRRARRLVLVVFGVVATAPAVALLLWIKGATPWSTMILLAALAAAVWSYETLSEGLRHRIARSAEALSSVKTAAETDCRELRWILDSLSLGVLTVEADGTLALERSAAVDDLFGEPDLGAKLWEYFAPVDPVFATSLERAWARLTDAKVPADLGLIQLPRKLCVRERHYDLEYRRMRAEERDATVLVILTDVTAEMARDRAELVLFETRSVLSQLERDRAGVIGAFTEAGASVTRLTRDIVRFDRHATLLELDALRARADELGIASLAIHCQELDGRLRDTRANLTSAERTELLALWSEVATRFEPWFGNGTESTRGLHVSLADQESLRQAILGQSPRTELLWLVDRWRHDPAGPRLTRLAEVAIATGRHAAKRAVQAAARETSARIDEAIAGKLWSQLTQAVRDALEHGLETDPDASDDLPPISIELRAMESEGETIVELVESGSWIDWSMPGPAMSKLRATCEAAGGSARIICDLTSGTTVQCRLPIMGARLSVTLPPMTAKGLWQRALVSTNVNDAVEHTPD